jgi:hypothetical protein
VEVLDENRQGSEVSFAAAGDEASSFSFNDKSSKTKSFKTTAAADRNVQVKAENEEDNDILQVDE